MRRHKNTGVERRRRSDLGFAVATAVLLAGFAFLVVTLQGLSHDLRTANEARDALAQQVERLGASPVAGPSGSRGQPGEGIVGPSGPPGPPGPASTASGPPGASGKPAPTLTPKPGASGASGAPGVPGATVTGPPGPAVTGPAGQDGADGKDGRDGTNGRDGADGQNCPDGYTLQPPPDDPDALVCRRALATPPAPDASSSLLGLGALTATSMYRRLDG